MRNGFEHDLKAVCDLAHSRGAKVYADAGQAVGAVPVDVRASGVDFLACSSYKWLMGDIVSDFYTSAKTCSIGFPADSTDFVNSRTCNITSFLTTRRRSGPGLDVIAFGLADVDKLLEALS
jgi:hypothetical protein